MKNSMKNVLVGVIALAVGYVGGAYIGLPQQDSSLNSGNISKVAGTNAIKFQQKMVADAQAKSEASSALSVMATQVDQFLMLSHASVAELKNIPEMKNICSEISDYEDLADIASSSAKSAMTSFDKLTGEDGEKEAPQYVMNSQNAMMNFMMVSNASGMAEDVVNAIDYYFHENGEGNQHLAAIRDMWVSYLKLNAVLRGDKAGVEKFNKMEPMVDVKQLEATSGHQDIAENHIEIMNYIKNLTSNPQMKNVLNAFNKPDKLYAMLGVELGSNYAKR